mmetsp:Transcript_2448/g.7248  ORF Transcript_2448/g.7248 Transcript_2448/m.7248 type:complete len:202 (-) Transcript_2448:773-1378(-)
MDGEQRQLAQSAPARLDGGHARWLVGNKVPHAVYGPAEARLCGAVLRRRVELESFVGLDDDLHRVGGRRVWVAVRVHAERGPAESNLDRARITSREEAEDRVQSRCAPHGPDVRRAVAFIVFAAGSVAIEERHRRRRLRLVLAPAVDFDLPRRRLERLVLAEPRNELRAHLWRQLAEERRAPAARRAGIGARDVARGRRLI